MRPKQTDRIEVTNKSLDLNEGIRWCRGDRAPRNSPFNKVAAIGALVVEARARGEVHAACIHELLALLLRRIHVRVPASSSGNTEWPIKDVSQSKSMTHFSHDMQG